MTTDMTSWPKYQSHKIVQAMPIIAFAVDATGARIAAMTADHQVFEPVVPAMLEKAAHLDFAVVYADGHRSISPKAAFDDGYTQVLS